VEAGIFAWDLYGEPTERAQHEASSLIKIYKHLVSDAVAQQPLKMNPQKHEEATFKAQEMKIKQEDAENATLGDTLSAKPTRRTLSPSSPVARPR
jgi:hypothetical protein